MAEERNALLHAFSWGPVDKKRTLGKATLQRGWCQAGSVDMPGGPKGRDADWLMIISDDGLGFSDPGRPH